MSNIDVKWVTDKVTGEPIFPITHIDAVRDDDGNPLSDYLNNEEVEIGDTTPTGDPKIFVDESADPSDSDLLDFYTQEETDGLLDGKQDTITDIKVLGCGYYTCATAGATAAKEVTASGFVLKPNCSFSVLFTNAFVVTQDNPTLNVNETGAKAIKFFGVSVPVGIIKANTICTLSYDGTDYIITNIEYKPKDDDLWVDLGLPSGVKWAKSNLDSRNSNGFKGTPFAYDCSFVSWGNIDDHTPQSTSAFGYTWNSSTYNNTRGKDLTGGVSLSQDVAKAILGSPWRIPTKEEFAELIANCDFIDASGNVISSSTIDKRVSVNNTVGIYLRSKANDNTIFLPCSGDGRDDTWAGWSEKGNYYTSSYRNTGTSFSFLFYESGVVTTYDEARYIGLSVRPVQ